MTVHLHPRRGCHRHRGSGIGDHITTSCHRRFHGGHEARDPVQLSQRGSRRNLALIQAVGQLSQSPILVADLVLDRIDLEPGPAATCGSHHPGD